MTDLDKSGYGYQRVRTYLGPSLGWTDEYVQPATEIKVGGTYVVQPGDSILLVNAAAAVTINLPDVRLWVQQTANQPATGFERSITIKDLGGNAANFNIVVTPFGQQVIDNINTSILISVSRSAIKLVPLIDMSGWAVALASISSGGGSGGGDVFKAGNNTFTGINTFVGPVTVPMQPTSDDSDNAASTAFVKDQNYITGAALLPYAPLFNPVFTGDPQGPTPPPGDNDKSLATTEFVTGAIASIPSGGAPVGAEYITSSANAALLAERVLTNTASVTWDFSTPGQAKANTSAGGGNVSSVPTPVNGQLAQWTTSTTIRGIDVSSLGFQPLDGDLTAISALTGTNTIYYRSAPDIWSPVTFSGLSFSGGILTVTAGGGNVNNSGVPLVTQYARWTDATHIEGRTPAQVLSDIGAAPLTPEYITSTADATLTAERVITDTATVTWDRTTAGQIKANASVPSGGFTQVKITTITTSQTFNRDANTKWLQLECCGPGGGGGGANCTSGRSGGGAGGGSGGYSRRAVSAAVFGASQTVTIGSVGGGATGTTSPGGNGVAVSIGALCIANGGQGGTAGSDTGGGSGGLGGVTAGAVGDLIVAGAPGGYGQGADTISLCAPAGGAGGTSYFGGGGRGTYAYSAFNGESAQGLGGGGAGGRAYNGSGGLGGAGGSGVAVITEYI